MLSSNIKKDRWQDLAEDLANPLKSPFDKPAVVQKLFAMTKDISESIGSVVTGKVNIILAGLTPGSDCL